MSNESNSPEEGVGETNEASLQASAENTVNATDYKSLEAEFTRTRQNEIELAASLVKASPESIAGLEPRLRDKVAKKLYGYENYAEMLAVEGEASEVAPSKANRPDLEAQLRKVEYRMERQAIESAIQKVLASYPDAGKDARDALEAELGFLSKEIPVEERVAKAAKLALGTRQNPPSPFSETVRTAASATPSTAESTAKPKDRYKAVQDWVKSL